MPELEAPAFSFAIGVIRHTVGDKRVIPGAVQRFDGALRPGSLGGLAFAAHRLEPMEIPDQHCTMKYAAVHPG